MLFVEFAELSSQQLQYPFGASIYDFKEEFHLEL